jgi:hypothetical protein
MVGIIRANFVYTLSAIKLHLMLSTAQDNLDNPLVLSFGERVNLTINTLLERLGFHYIFKSKHYCVRKNNSIRVSY